MGAIMAFLRVFRQGSALSNSAAWKNGQITVTALTGFLVAALELLRRFGVDLPVTTEQLGVIAAGVLAVVNVGLTVATSDKVGLPAETPPAEKPAAPDDKTYFG